MVYPIEYNDKFINFFKLTSFLIVLSVIIVLYDIIKRFYIDSVENCKINQTINTDDSIYNFGKIYSYISTIASFVMLVCLIFALNEVKELDAPKRIYKTVFSISFIMLFLTAIGYSIYVDKTKECDKVFSQVETVFIVLESMTYIALMFYIYKGLTSEGVI